MYENIEKIKIIKNSQLQITYTHKNNADLKTIASIDFNDLHIDFMDALNNVSNSLLPAKCNLLLSAYALDNSTMQVEEIKLNFPDLCTIKFKCCLQEFSIDREKTKKFKNFLIETPPFRMEDLGNLNLQTLLNEVHAIIKGKRAQLDLLKDTVLKGNEEVSITLEAQE